MVYLTKPQKVHMEQLIRQGRDPNDIKKRFGCFRSTIERATNRILGFGSIEDPKLCKRGPKFKFTAQSAQMKEELGWLLIQRPDYYQEELQFYFLEHWHFWPSQPTLSRTISSMELTWKRAQFKAAQQRDDLRNVYLQRITQLVASQLIYADESSMSDKTLDRKYGYAPKGLPATVIREKHRSERYSLLPAYGMEGFLDDPLIVKGSVTGELFVDWLIHSVLPPRTAQFSSSTIAAPIGLRLVYS
jgi:transposase